MYSVLKIKEVKHVGSVKSVKRPFISRMFQGIPHKNIILGEYLHSIHYSKNLKKNLQQFIFHKYFCMDLHFYAVDRPSWVFKSELIWLRCTLIYLLHLKTKKAGLDSRQGKEILLFSTASRLALEPTKISIQRVLYVLSLGVKPRGMKLTSSLHSSKHVCRYT
jgi:hypothetical protein